MAAAVKTIHIMNVICNWVPGMIPETMNSDMLATFAQLLIASLLIILQIIVAESNICYEAYAYRRLEIFFRAF